MSSIMRSTSSSSSRVPVGRWAEGTAAAEEEKEVSAGMKGAGPNSATHPTVAAVWWGETVRQCVRTISASMSTTVARSCSAPTVWLHAGAWFMLAGRALPNGMHRKPADWKRIDMSGGSSRRNS